MALDNPSICNKQAILSMALDNPSICNKHAILSMALDNPSLCDKHYNMLSIYQLGHTFYIMLVIIIIKDSS
jgi:hypothetical protein